MKKLENSAKIEHNKNIVIFSLYSRSGMWHYATQYCNGLSEYKNIFLVCSKYADKKPLKKQVNKIEINSSYRITSFIIESLNFFQHIRIVKKILKTKSDNIHFLDSHPWSIGYMILFKFFGKKVIITQHDPIQHTGEPRAFIQKLINKIQRKLSTKIIVHGKFNKSEMIKKYNINPNKVVIFTMGNFEFLKKHDQKNKINTTQKKILFFGRILEYKGIGLLLNSLQYLDKKNIKYKLMIVGSGDIKKYKHLIRKYKKDIELINRYIDEKEISYFFKKASFIILPYLDATQTGIIPIAYAYKKPVLVTNVGALPEVVDNKKTGIIVKPNEKSISKGIEWMLNYADLKKLGENAYKKMRNDLDWRKNIKNILKVYR